MKMIKINRKLKNNDECWCGSGKTYENCHMDFDKKIQLYKKKNHVVPPKSIIKTPTQLEGISLSSNVNVAVLDYVAANIRIGMTTEEINTMVYEKTTELGGIPAPLNYQGYPKSACTSINEQICHGIPSEHVNLVDGDIVNVDVSTILNGYYSDSSRMFCIGNVAPEVKKLVDVAKECVDLGLQQVKPWGFLGDIGQVINDHAKANGFSVVREVGGHGIGLKFHETPFVSYVTKKGTDMLMVPGMVFTIEPMINMGSSEIYIDDSNGWTIYTDDELPSAQWEIMVAVTEDGHQVLAW